MKGEYATVIQGNIDALDQAIVLLKTIDDEQYGRIMQPYVKSNIGQHIRHIVDIYAALIDGIEDGVVDYDKRTRGSAIETDRLHALSICATIKSWFSECIDTGCICGKPFSHLPLNVSTEVQLLRSNSIQLTSDFLRECVFTCSHAVHHFAIIQILAKLQNIQLDENFGVAPATASYLRELAN